MTVERAQIRVWNPATGRYREVIDKTSPEYVPALSRLITDGAPTCRLLYRAPDKVLFPRRAYHGQVTCVEYTSLRGQPHDVREANALVKLFKEDADPIVVGLGYHALKRLQAFSPHMVFDFHPQTANDHHWQVVWPRLYKAQFKERIRTFFAGLLRIAFPGFQIGSRWERYGFKGSKKVRYSRKVRKYEFFRWSGEHATPDEFYECVAGPTQILFKIGSKSMREASDADTDEGIGSEPDQELNWVPHNWDPDGWEEGLDAGFGGDGPPTP
jgi:hypothetical protein